MNVLICTESPALYNRLETMLSVLSDFIIINFTSNLAEAETASAKTDVQVLITAFHNIKKSYFKVLKRMKNNNKNMVVIVLNNNPSDQYLIQWKEAGADFIFDQAMDVSKVVDVLTELGYKNLIENLRSN